MRLIARVPATVANLGPGFDCFGLALELCNEVTVDTEAEPGVSWDGEGADELPTDGTDMVSRAMRYVLHDAQQSFGETIELPQLHLLGMNRIPLQRGLGSSAAAVVAGVALATTMLHLGDLRTPLGTLSLAGSMEGHWDNAAAAVFGGFTIATPGAIVRLDPHPELHPVVLIPEHVRLSTEEARRALPQTVPLDDAVHNIGNAAVMVHAMTNDPSRLLAGIGDRLHQDVRLGLVPEVREVFERLERVPVPVCVSGAGPSLLAFESERFPVPDPGPGWRLLRIAPRAAGVEVEGA